SLKGRAMPKCKTGLALSLHLAVTVVLCVVVYKRLKCPQGTYGKAAVAADSETCSEIGRDILQQGGSAVDAAIAALLCTSVINPQSSGIGGGNSLTIFIHFVGNVKIINSRETVPSKVTSGLLYAYSTKPFSFFLLCNKWIGVPGEIRGYEAAHKLYGKLPWATLFQPTIKLAREGIKIPEVQAVLHFSLFSLFVCPFRKLFSDKKGNLLKIGGTVKFEKLADTLEIIANNGADSFYSGKIAEDLVHDVQQAGGILTLQDLAMYKVNVTDAWTVPLGEYQMYIPPPPAGGAVLSLVLNILKGSSPESFEEKTHFYHLYAEAFKFANRLKKYIRDPKFVSEDVKDSFASKIRAKIKTNITLIDYNIPLNTTDSQTDDDPSRSPVSGGTTHVSVLAEDGSAVSVTSSINRVFGSKIYSSQTGVILNNQLADFCGRVNISPGEQPPSSFSPSVLKSKSKTLVIGASGASFITTAMASTLINHLWFKKSLKEAIDDPVIFVDPEDKVMFEPKWDKVKHLEYFYGWGHKITRFYNAVNAVEKDCGCIYAVSDTRKNGKAAGY
uniref:Glutathione hydrolase n=1 Tax=Kryptolebias marmoratus TaxID=37003 RepID=A0A3Q3AHZ1_KRYMA